jgi:hypothetical protein
MSASATMCLLFTTVLLLERFFKVEKLRSKNNEVFIYILSCFSSGRTYLMTQTLQLQLKYSKIPAFNVMCIKPTTVEIPRNAR